MNTAVTDVITSYKSRTIKTLRDQQIALTPCLDPNIYEERVTSYIFDTQRQLVNPLREACFRLHYMYLKSMPPRKYIEYSVSRHPIEYLVAEEVIDPFLFFINGVMIPWRIMEIIMTHETYHILCTTEDQYWLDILRNPTDVQVIHLPSGCVYCDYPIGYAYNKIFGFDDLGQFSNDPKCHISIVDESKFMDYYKGNNIGDDDTSILPVNALCINDDTSIKYFSNNVIIFRNHLLDVGSDIKFSSTLLTIDNGNNPFDDVLDFVVFRDIRTKDTADNIKNASLAYIEPLIKSQNAGEEVPEYLPELQTEFDFEMSRKKSYQQNVDESIDYIMNYNPSLFEESYMVNKNLTIEEKSGYWVIENTREDGTLMIPRRHGEFNEEYIIMLVNGVMYKFYYMMKYTSDYCIIPIKDINGDDIIEFLRFDDINNSSFDITIRENDLFEKYDKNYINDKMVLFSTIPPTQDFVFPEDGLQHFPVAYTLEKDESDEEKVRIRLEDSRYYGVPLKMVYHDQFKHYWFDISGIDPNATEYAIDLGKKFMYCHDYSRYMVFFNGHRLGTDQYRMCLPVRSTTPFYKFELYLTMAVNDGDRVDVLYTPSLLKDIIFIPEINDDGKITVDLSDITYATTTNLYMIWANGKKIPRSSIENIDSTHIRIVDDIETVKHICVTKFLPDIDELTEVFKTSKSLWDRIMSRLTSEEVEQILEHSGVVITNTEEDIYTNSVSVRSVMLELIREKYMMNALVDTTGPFVYGYLDVDDTIVEDYDTAGNAVLESGDANLTENIDHIERYWP